MTRGIAQVLTTMMFVKWDFPTDKSTKTMNKRSLLILWTFRFVSELAHYIHCHYSTVCFPSPAPLCCSLGHLIKHLEKLSRFQRREGSPKKRGTEGKKTKLLYIKRNAAAFSDHIQVRKIV